MPVVVEHLDPLDHARLISLTAIAFMCWTEDKMYRQSFCCHTTHKIGHETDNESSHDHREIEHDSCKQLATIVA